MPFFASLATALLSLTATAPQDHRVRIDHPGGGVDALYRTDVTVRHRQQGSASPAGAAATLRCRWSADVTVLREARGAAGMTLNRAITREGVLTGVRPGWCASHRRAIAKEVAARGDQVREALLAAVAEDRPALVAELDRAHADRREG